VERKDIDLPHEEPVIGRIDFSGKDVLEVGCGCGAFTLEHLGQANSILCIEPKNEAIECLKEQWVDLPQPIPFDARQAKIEDYPLPQESFDVVVFSSSL
jgi:2-polyprenyl-3-methyl-5-hydroxy-6-metoxy-1,4-benzoquinol methylase